MPGALPWIDAIARQRGLRYEPEADERWLRAWEPYTTLKVPFRYEHALLATGATGSLSIARAVIELPPPPSPTPLPPTAVGTWIAIVQDERIQTKGAATNDFGSVFAEPLEIIGMARFPTGDPSFDHSFAAFGPSPDGVAEAISPSVRRLLLSWRTPVHVEIRPGGFILAPVTLSADDRGLWWMLDAIHLFGQKATKPRT